jgi:tRNA-2-methylthio-N6-dimethylallyladenosine synthase
MNQSDSEHYAGQLESLGYEETADYKKAAVVILNTCCVREGAEQKIRGKIGEFKFFKKEHPDAVLAIAGCMAQKGGEALLSEFKQIDLVLGTFYISSFTGILQEFLQTRRRQAFVDEKADREDFSGGILRKSAFSAWIPVTHGCNNYCSYCIVPYVRGRERSRPFQAVMDEVASVAGRYKEIVLLGQNVNSYASGGTNFAGLLSAVDQTPGVERIRFMTSHPRDMGEDVIKAVAAGERICEHFHLPVQAGGDRVLKAMNRGYSRDGYLRLIESVRRHVPAASVTTDIIVGFPGETEEDFADTLSLVESARYDAAYTFIYSPRSGTPAAGMDGQVPEPVKKARLKALMELQNKISLDINGKLAGSVQTVMVEGASATNESNLSGRTRANKIVIFPRDGRSIAAGETVPVKITSGQTWLLKGTIAKR